eukprot:1157718-Pelagomonas_calceolata.AAC.17
MAMKACSLWSGRLSFLSFKELSNSSLDNRCGRRSVQLEDEYKLETEAFIHSVWMLLTGGHGCQYPTGVQHPGGREFGALILLRKASKAPASAPDN